MKKNNPILIAGALIGFAAIIFYSELVGFLVILSATIFNMGYEIETMEKRIDRLERRLSSSESDSQAP